MIKGRIFFDDDRELAEVIRLLSPRLNYCRTFPEESPKKAIFGIETGDLLVADESGEEAPEEGGNDDV